MLPLTSAGGPWLPQEARSAGNTPILTLSHDIPTPLSPSNTTDRDRARPAEHKHPERPSNTKSGSNVALGLYPALRDHPVNFFHSKNLPISISTDDPPFFSTTLSKEYEDLHNAFGWEEDTFNKINQRSLQFSFAFQLVYVE
jgi:hypothetical protein